ncbi:hypothetical protein ACLMJK_004879 [Lecanora helva]
MAAANKRDTLFPGSSVLGKRDSSGSPRLSASQLPPIPDFPPNKRRTPLPAPLPVKINPNSQSFSSNGRFQRLEPSISLAPICRMSNPWLRYHAILEEAQGDWVTIANAKEPKHPIVVIKRRACPSDDVRQKIIGISHENIVALYEAYLYEGNLYFAYELMDVSLAEMQSTPYGILAEFHIATICKEVITGVQYIHRKLKIVHGSIDARWIMVSRSGCIKLANIGESMSKDIPFAENERQDFQDLGLLMVRLMEAGTGHDGLELMKPEKWNNEIKRFLKKTQECSGEELEQDVFLEQSPGSHCFKPLVLLTERSIGRAWEYRMD